VFFALAVFPDPALLFDPKEEVCAGKRDAIVPSFLTMWEVFLEPSRFF